MESGAYNTKKTKSITWRVVDIAMGRPSLSQKEWYI